MDEKFERLVPKGGEVFDRMKVAKLIDAHSDAIEAMQARLEDTRRHTMGGLIDIFAEGLRDPVEED
jgi:hypothetical protein